MVDVSGEGEVSSEYRLDRYRLVRLVVRRADGSPATAAEVLVGEQPSISSKSKQPSWITDQRGEAVASALVLLQCVDALSLGGPCRVPFGTVAQAFATRWAPAL